MATIRRLQFLVDADSGQADAVLAKMRERIGQLDRMLKDPTQLNIDDKAAAAVILKTRIAADKLRERIEKPMDLSLRGLGKAEAQLLALEGAADRTRRKLSGSGAAGAGAAAGTGGLLSVVGSATQGVPLLGALGPGGALAAAAATIAALPFAATAAASAITVGLGGAIAGLGIIAAAKTKEVTKSFDKLKTDASRDFTALGRPFVSVLQGILTAADNVLPYVFRPLAAAMKEIAPPLQQLGEVVANSFASPRIQSAIAAVAKAFSQFLAGFSGQIPGIVNALATGIESIANSFTRHPDMIAGMAKVLAFLLKLPGYVASGLAALTNVTHWLLFGLPHDISIGLDAARKFFERFGHGVEAIWNTMKRSVEDAALELAKVVLIGFRGLSNGVLNVVGGMIHGLAAAFGWLPFGVGSSLKNAAKSFDSWHNHFNSGVNNQIAKIQQMQDRINGLHGKTVGITVRVTGSGGEYITSTTGANGRVTVYPVRAAAAGMFVSQGTGPRADDVLARVSKGELIIPAHMVSAGAVDHLRGKIPGFAAGGLAGAVSTLGSYAQGYFSQMNAQVLASTLGSVSKRVASSLAAAFAGGLSTSAAVRAEQLYAARLFPYFGWGAGQLGPLIALWQRESGWNPNARNPTSGAFGIPQALPPSKMGALGSTWAGQILWGLNYIKGRYGSPGAAWAHEQAFNWYGHGGTFAAGQLIGVGDRGPELAMFGQAGRVFSPEQSAALVAGAGGNRTYNITVNVPPTASKADTGRAVVECIREYERGSGTGWRKR